MIMNTIKIFQHTEGAIRSRKGDTVISRTYHFSTNILNRYIEEKAPKGNAIMYMAYVKETDSFMVAHIQKNHVIFPGENRAYTTRSVFEVSKEETSEKKFKFGSIISLFPHMPKDGYERRVEEYVAEECEWKLMKDEEFSEKEKIEIQNISAQITTAFNERKKIYIKIPLHRENYYAGILQEALPFKQLLSAIDNLPDNIRPYASFAFLANNALKDIHKDYLIIAYQEEDGFVVPDNAIKVDWGELQQENNHLENVTIPSFISDGNYSISHLYAQLSSAEEKKKELLNSNHQPSIEDLEHYNYLLKSQELKAKEIECVRIQIAKILYSDFEKLKEYILSETQDLDLKQELESLLNKSVITAFKESGIDAFEIFNICERINKDKTLDLLKDDLKPKQLDTIIEYIKKYKDSYNSLWGWEAADLSFYEYGDNGEEELQELIKANHPLATLILCKIDSLKKKILGLQKDAPLGIDNLRKLQDAITRKDSETAFFESNDFTSFVDVLLNYREKLSDRQIAKEFGRLLKYAKKRIKDEERLKEVESILSNNNIQSELRQFAKTYSKQLSATAVVIMIVGTSISSFFMGIKYGERNALSSFVAKNDTITPVNSEIVVAPQYDTLFAYILPQNNVLSKNSIRDTLVISEDLSLFAASVDTATHILKRYMIDSVAVKDGKIENDSCPYKYKNITNTDYYVWVLEQIEKLKVKR